MNYSLTIELTQEQNDALLATAAEMNAAGGSTTPEALLRENGTNFVNQRVQHYYEAAMKRLGTAAAVMPYDQRKALIAQVESQLPTEQP